MVQAFTLVIFAFAVAPILAAPVHQGTVRGSGQWFHRYAHSSQAAVAKRSFDGDDLELLDARDPKFSLGKVFKKVGRVAGKVGGVALKAAPLLVRDMDSVEDDLALREFMIDDEFSGDLEAREPKFRFGSVLKKAGGFAGKAFKVAGKAAGAAQSLGLRELEDSLEERDLDWDVETMEARESIDELD